MVAEKHELGKVVIARVFVSGHSSDDFGKMSAIKQRNSSRSGISVRILVLDSEFLGQKYPHLLQACAQCAGIFSGTRLAPIPYCSLV